MNPEPAPPTAPAFITHPSWAGATRVDLRQPPPPLPRHRAPDSGEIPEPVAVEEIEETPEPEEYEESPGVGTTAIVLMCAMFCLTLTVAIVSLFGDPRGGAVLAGVVACLGAGFAYLFRDRWK